MELNELLKMISSIPQRKSKCRGNLRLKVLLKTTYDYARSSWIDGQFGKPQKLQTLLKNSISDHSTSSSSDSSSLSSDSEASLNFEEAAQLKALHSEQLMDTSNETCDDILRSDLALDDDEEAENELNGGEETKEDLPELKRVMKKLLKNCNMLIEIDEQSRSSIPDYHLNLRKLKRIIHLSRIARIHLERNYENQDFGQQKINRKTLKLVRYLLKQCKTLLKVNYNSEIDHRKLKKILRKLKKFESCAEKIIAYEKYCEEAQEDTNSYRHPDKVEALGRKEVLSEYQLFSSENDPVNSSDSINSCHYKQISSHKNIPLIQPSNIKYDMNDENSKSSEIKQSSLKRSRSEMEKDLDSDTILQFERFYRNFKAMKHS